MPRLMVILLAVLSAASAFGQVQSRQPQPVDQAVGDLDPLATSFRRIEPGLQLFNRASALRPVDQGGWAQRGGVPVDPLTGLPMPQAYVYSAPGFRAYLPQAEYVVRSRTDPYNLDRNVAPATDGEFAHLAPANMVYDLVYRADRHTTPPLNPAAVDGRMDTRIDRRLPAQPPGSNMGNVDYTDGVSHRSPQQTLIDFYRGENRQAVDDGQLQRSPMVDRAKPQAASGAQEQVVDQADAAEARGDERDNTAGE